MFVAGFWIVATPIFVGIGYGVKELNSYVAYVSRRVLNSRYTKFGLNRLRGQRVNLEHTDRQTHRQTDTHSLLFIRFIMKKIEFITIIIECLVFASSNCSKSVFNIVVTRITRVLILQYASRPWFISIIERLVHIYILANRQMYRCINLKNSNKAITFKTG
jgi:hypothetical protein